MRFAPIYGGESAAVLARRISAVWPGPVQVVALANSECDGYGVSVELARNQVVVVCEYEDFLAVLARRATAAVDFLRRGGSMGDVPPVPSRVAVGIGRR